MIRTLIGAAVVVIAGCVMIARTWRAWPDPLVDFGRELYVAWRISEGAVLYRDVAYFNGPLSPHVNGMIFRIAGPGIITLAIVNLAVFFAIALLSYDLLRRAGDVFSAAAAGVTLAVLFGFIQLVDIANYNYATPYSHELTHGLLLSLGAIGCMVRARGGTIAWAAAGGALAGFTFLTKPEPFLAVAAALAVVIWTHPRRLRTAAVGVVGVMVPVLVALALLAGKLGAAGALRGVAGGWMYAFDRQVSANPFYRTIAGFDAPIENAVWMLMIGGAWAAVIGTGATLALMARGGSGRRRDLLVLIGVLAPPSLAWLFFAQIPWTTLFVPLPLAMAVLIVVTLVRIRRCGADESLVIRLVWCVFALTLLAKMILRPTVSHYGFVLAMPATLGMVAAVTGWLRLNDRAAMRVLRAAMVSIVATVAGAHIIWAFERFYCDKMQAIGTGRDRFLAREADPRAPAVAAMAERIARDVPPEATLAVVPEGAMLNYLTRRRNPTPYVTLLPPEFLMFGADNIIAAYRNNPPDYIVIAPRDLHEYGSEGFAVDYASELAAWIASHYREIASEQSGSYRMRLMARQSE